MKKIMDKLKGRLKTSRKMIVFFLVLLMIGISSGTIFSLVISKSDKALVNDTVQNFFEAIQKNEINFMEVFKNTIFDNGANSIFMWLLGISVIGIPILLFLYFSKAFIFGFSIGSILLQYKAKGIFLCFFYIFPHQVLNLLLYTFLLLYALSLSIKLFFVLIRRKTIDFKPIMNKYILIFVITLLGFLFTALYEAYFMPKIVQIILPML